MSVRNSSSFPFLPVEFPGPVWSWVFGFRVWGPCLKTIVVTCNSSTSFLDLSFESGRWPHQFFFSTFSSSSCWNCKTSNILMTDLLDFAGNLLEFQNFVSVGATAWRMFVFGNIAAFWSFIGRLQLGVPMAVAKVGACCQPSAMK